MAKFKIPVDLKSVTTEWPIAPAGTYPASIKTTELKVSKKGNPMLVIGLHPLAPVLCMCGDQQKTVQPQDRQIWTWYVVLSDDPQKGISLKQLQTAVGGNWNVGDEIDTNMLIGKMVNVTVSIDTGDNGKPQQGIDNVSKM